MATTAKVKTPKFGKKLGSLYDKTTSFVKDTLPYNWKGSGLGLKLGERTIPIGKFANVGNAVMQGANAVNSLQNIGSGNTDLSELRGDINRSAGANPLYSQYLTTDQLRDIRSIQRGNYNTGVGTSDFFDGVKNGFGDILTGGLTGAVGGLPGILIGAGGAALNSGLNGITNAQQSKASDLESLYAALQEAEMQYKNRRQPNYTGLGIS